MKKAIFTGILILIQFNLFSQTFAFELTEAIVEEGDTATIELRKNTWPGFDTLEMAIKYDPEALVLDTFRTIFPPAYFQIQESSGLISLKFIRESLFPPIARILYLDFVVNMQEGDCTNVEWVDLDLDQPIRLVAEGEEYLGDEIELTHGGVAVKNKIDDPIVQNSFDLGSSYPSIKVQYDIDNEGCFFPNGAIGKDFFLQSVGDKTIRVFDRLGRLNSSIDIDEFANEFFEADDNYASVIYDHRNKNWILARLIDRNVLQVLVFEYDDAFKLLASQTLELASIIRNPSFVLSGETLVMSTKEYFSDQFKTWFINISDLNEGLNEIRMKELELPIKYEYHDYQILSPASANNPNGLSQDEIYLFSLRDDDWYKADGDFLELIEVEMNWDNDLDPIYQSSEIPLSAFDLSRTCCIPDAYSNTPSLRQAFIVNPPQYYEFDTHESLVFCFTTNVSAEVSRLGIRWVELRRKGTEEWELYQEGSFAPEGEDQRYFGSISMDKNENIFLAYNISNINSHIKIGFTGRTKNDPLGLMTFEEKILLGEAELFPFGILDGPNFIQISQDVYEEDFFWFTANLGGGNKVVAVDFTKDDIDLSLSDHIGLAEFTTLQEEETLNVQVGNSGLEPVDQFSVEVFINDQKVFEEEVLKNILPGKTETVELSNKLNLPTPGIYKIKTVLSLEDDEFLSNNTHVQAIRRVNSVDVDLSWIKIDDNCHSSPRINSEFSYRNIGFKTIEEANFVVSINGRKAEVIKSEEALDYLDEATIEFEYEEMLETENSIKVDLTSIVVDGVEYSMAKEIVSPLFLTEERSRFLELGIHLDDNPHETLWTLSELETGIIVAEGGPYFEENEWVWEKYCLSPYYCYLFKIEDLGENGINNFKSYLLKTNLNQILIEENGLFNDKRVHGFCMDGQRCQIKPEIILSKASNREIHDGQIEIELLNRVEQFEYRVAGEGPFFSDPVFRDLITGYYDVEVRSVDGECEYEEQVYLGHLGLVGVDHFISSGDLKVTPNPATEIVHISLKNVDSAFEQTSTVELYDSTGKQVSVSELKRVEDGLGLSVQHLPKGIYLIKLNQGEKKYMGKMVKL